MCGYSFSRKAYGKNECRIYICIHDIIVRGGTNDFSDEIMGRKRKILFSIVSSSIIIVRKECYFLAAVTLIIGDKIKKYKNTNPPQKNFVRDLIDRQIRFLGTL